MVLGFLNRNKTAKGAAPKVESVKGLDLLVDPAPKDASTAQDPASYPRPDWVDAEKALKWQLDVPKQMDGKDDRTADAWISRHPDIVRLTGRHPLNCEPPLTTLMECGFITPPALHYVRNHGAVPKIKWEDHRITVNGLVDRPMTFTMDDILKMPSRRIPVTLVCAGNRRKEENMIKKTIGFSWGAAGVSTSYWTGVRLCDVLKACGIKSPEQGARYVSFRGPKKELPQGEDGSYGTSVTYDVAMNPADDVMICYKQNDAWLTPDHGFPVRLIIPGFIGGRMIKFLEEITVQEKESDNFYHYYDNRLLPSHVDQEVAKREGWWQRPDFIINQLNINSACAYPQNDEIVPLDGSVKEYLMRGYAYTGGGRKIIRVEVTWDNGHSWHLADIHRFEAPTEYGRHWCWVFWSYKMPIGNFVKTKEFAVRAWDDAMNTQPVDITWNVTGMMNNSLFRVKLSTFINEETGCAAIRCQHPTVAGPSPGGWMVPPEEQPAAPALPPAPAAVAPPAPAAAASDAVKVVAPAAPVVSLTASAASGLRRFTTAEVAQHNKEDDVYLIYHGKVYDATSYIKDHPGGVDSIMINAGEDCTEEFDAIHSKKAKELIEKYVIGVLDDSGAEAAAAPSTPPPAGAAVVPALGAGLAFLEPKKKLKAPLIHREELSHNVRLYRFGLPAPLMKLGMPVGKHMFVYGRVNGELVVRAYTPATGDEVRGYFDLIVKVYFKSPSFPEGGKMSQHLDSLAIGDEIEVKGPTGHFEYTGLGNFTLHNHETRHCKFINMVAGGTGITPMWNVLKAVLADKSDPTKIRLLFANTTPADIMLKRELDDFAARYSDKFQVFYTITKDIHSGWGGFTGRINDGMLKQVLFPPSPDTITQLCGPSGMVDQCCKPLLEALGYAKDDVIIF